MQKNKIKGEKCIKARVKCSSIGKLCYICGKVDYFRENLIFLYCKNFVLLQSSSSSSSSSAKPSSKSKSIRIENRTRTTVVDGDTACLGYSLENKLQTSFHVNVFAYQGKFVLSRKRRRIFYKKTTEKKFYVVNGIVCVFLSLIWQKINQNNMFYCITTEKCFDVREIFLFR